MSVNMSEMEYLEHENDYNGICANCETIKYGGTEPDAENYECEECGKFAVQGMMNALLDGLIVIYD